MARPPKWNTPQELKDEISDYFGICDEKEKMPTKAGLALHLDTTRETLGDYENGSRDKDNANKGSDTFSYAIKRAYNIIEDAWTQNLRGANATGSIFYLKAAFHYSDRSEIDVTSKGEKINATDPKALAVSQEYEKKLKEKLKE